MIVPFLLAASCQKNEKGSIEFFFTHTVDGNPVQFNQLSYTTAAKNPYLINEIKYFISKLFLIDTDGNSIEIKQNDGIHYVDCSIENSLRWKIDEIPERDYTTISFVFGLDENNNKSNRFVNPPESNFSWPDPIGGGYHYMQINGKFVNKEGALLNMNIHTGIGQLYNENHEITQFVHNYFTVTLPFKFFVGVDNTTTLSLNMEIQHWFDTPNLYDFNEFGTGIMQNQKAQEMLKKNGENVFDVQFRITNQ
ncbi:MAG: hypothetical protein FWC10_08965 [Lentimicrobiaceae bacterium]|nr:hypothetical protein [Lentimicrobiaceae bacterium]